MNFDIKAAVHFVVVADEASFTRAAERLRLAQPWLSQRIRALEQQLGFALFTRTTRRIELTDKGRAFLAVARPIAEAAEAAAHVARVLGREAGGRLRIGVPPYSARIPVRTKLVSSFIAKHPEIELELEIGWTPVLLERVLTGSLDAMFGIGWPRHEALRQAELCALQVELLIPPDDPLATSSAPLPASRLTGRRIAVFPRGLYPDLFDAVFQPLETAGAVLIPDPEFYDRLIEPQGDNASIIIANIGMGDGPHRPGQRVRRLLEGAPAVPFSFVSRADTKMAAVEGFWGLVG